jgi:hypothetical protein
MERSTRKRTVGRTWRVGLQIAACGIASLPFAGCSREHYRVNADKAAFEVVDGENNDPRWRQPNFTVYPDERSRFFDPTPPDRPPAPEDDPESNKFMQCVYGMKGYRGWYKDGAFSDPQNPNWLEQLPSYTTTTPDGRLLLNLDSAVVLARLHNIDYQRNLEEIFLAALDVAFERFQFDVQFAGSNTTTYTTRGNLAPTTVGQTGPQPRGQSSSILSTVTDIEASRQFASGAQLLVGFANSFVWQFAGPDTNYAASVINFSLLQPLLRGGGRDVILEQLTRAERSLLAALRSQAQYRQDFTRNIAVGGTVTAAPRRIGGFQGGAGLSGFTGTGQGGFGGVGEGQNFGTTGANRNNAAGGGGAASGFAGGGEGTVAGFYGLAQRIQAIRNTQNNLANQLLTLGLLESLADAGLIDTVQVDEFRQNVETERANLLRVQVSLQDTLEFYLLDVLGLPPTLRIAIDDTILKQFEFVDEAQFTHQRFANDLLRKAGGLPETPTIDQLNDLQNDVERLQNDVAADIQAVGKEFQDSQPRLAERTDQQPDPRDRATYLRDFENLRAGLESLTKQNAADQARLDQLTKQTAPGREKASLGQTVELIRAAAGRLQEAGLYQARVRLERVEVPKVDLDFPCAYLIARTNRLDWMNNRAAFVDQWRLIALNANRLEAVLDVQLDGDIGTFGDNPFRFNADTGTLRARLVFDAPLNRVAERNLYRESLISYQRARRNYINYIDTVAFSLRTRLRDLQRLRENLEIQRQSLVIAIRRVDRTLQELNAPFTPPAPGQAQTQLSPVLATNLLRALSDFRSTQDNFTSVYFAYESSRLNLLFALGTLKLDDDGRWIDVPMDEIKSQCFTEVGKLCDTGGPILLPEELDYLGVERKKSSEIVQAAFETADKSGEKDRSEGPRSLKITTASLMPLPPEEIKQAEFTQANDAHPLAVLMERQSAAMAKHANETGPNAIRGYREGTPIVLPEPTITERITAFIKGEPSPTVAKLYSKDGVKLSDDGRKRFVKEMNEVRSLAGRGMQPAEIAVQMKLDERVVRAHLAMGTWMQPPNAEQVPAK